MGYLTPDSWRYLRLARGLYVSGYPSLAYPSLGEAFYDAHFPFGYPLLSPWSAQASIWPKPLWRRSSQMPVSGFAFISY
jgi:hypothetical protein